MPSGHRFGHNMKYFLLGLLLLFFIIVAVKIFPYVAILAFDTAENIKSRYNKAYKLEKVLDYVARHDGEIFSHETASKELNIAPMQIYKRYTNWNNRAKSELFPGIRPENLF